jgi:hypothetical protein
MGDTIRGKVTRQVWILPEVVSLSICSSVYLGEGGEGGLKKADRKKRKYGIYVYKLFSV